MQFMMIVKADKDYEAGIPPSPELIANIGRLSEEMIKAGILLQTGGLQPTANGMRLSYAGGKRVVVDGPFAEAKEVIGGYAVVEVPSKADALVLAHRFAQAHVDAGVDEIHMEIRPMWGDPRCNPGSRPS